MIEINDKAFCFKVGNHYKALDRLLLKFKANSAVFFTAYNPQSKQLTDQQNQQQHQFLLSQVNQLKLSFIHGFSSDPLKSWPNETSIMIFNITQQAANRLQQSFNQNAYLWISLNQKVKLCFA